MKKNKKKYWERPEVNKLSVKSFTLSGKNPNDTEGTPPAKNASPSS